METARRKPTMAFVDHSFHKKTGSGDFLRELFAPHFEIINYYDESWDGGPGVKAEEINRHEYVFFEQTFFPIARIGDITAKIVWAPMYDGFESLYSFWKLLALENIRIINFSEKMLARSRRFGIESIYKKYYIDPKKYAPVAVSKGNRIFFWYRGNISFADIKKMLNPAEVESFIYRSNPDPNVVHELLSEEDKRLYKITEVKETYGERSGYIKLLSQANIFIAPRKKEGIGMSFLEAAAMGMAVVGNDEGTMNEYIVPGKTGYLFSIAHPQVLDFSNRESIQAQSLAAAELGYERWEREKQEIIDFILKPFPPKKPRLFLRKFLLALYAFEARIPKIKRWFIRYAIRARKMVSTS